MNWCKSVNFEIQVCEIKYDKFKLLEMTRATRAPFLVLALRARVSRFALESRALCICFTLMSGARKKKTDYNLQKGIQRKLFCVKTFLLTKCNCLYPKQTENV